MQKETGMETQSTLENTVLIFIECYSVFFSFQFFPEHSLMLVTFYFYKLFLRNKPYFDPRKATATLFYVTLETFFQYVKIFI
jgi:hypothetical protein